MFDPMAFASTSPVVSIVASRVPKAAHLKQKEIRTMVQNAIEMAGGLRSIIKDGHTVVIKPNLVATRDSNERPLAKEVNGVTTDWRIVKVLSELIREINPKGKILVMEGSAQNSTEETMRYYNFTPQAMPAVDEFIGLENSSGTWRNTQSPELVRVPLLNGLLRKEYYLNRRYKEADVVISVPVLKTHWDAIVTGAIKNLAIGAAPPSMYAEQEGSAYHGSAIDHEHPRLDYWIHDFYLCRPADFAIMDGLQGLQNGPLPSSENDKMNMRLIFASREPIALDSVAAQVMVIKPDSVLHLHELAKSRSINLSNIIVKGESIDAVKKPFSVRLPTK
ncbi:MAG: DUF362 domain-containing protein [Bdellovibrio sp.]|nr:DUF362 domain-containing protein [Bdellovibrio sp.]